MKTLALISLVFAGLILGCRHDESLYCPAGETCYFDAPRALDSPVDAFVCSATTPCPAGSAAVCDLDNDAEHGMCVACTGSDASACTGTTPACGSDHACRACIAHSDCASDACLPDGSCGSAGNVAYVAPTGSGSACTFAAPCATVTTALATARPYVKITGTIDDAVTVSGGQVVTFLADPGAELKRSTAGTTLAVSGNGTSLAIYDLTISNGAADPSSIGLQIANAATPPTVSLNRVTVSGNDGGGVVTTGGTLNIERSTITQNPGGGLSLSGAQFHIENSFVTQNGGTTTFGGVKLGGISASGTYEFDFDTIAGNIATGAFVAGVQCNDVGAPVVFDSDIVYDNSNSGGTTSTQLTAFIDTSQCTPTYSDLGGSGSATGSGNLNADPSFIDAGDVPGNFHIQAGSPCIGAADPSLTSVTTDFDGDPRGSSRDVGADQVGP